MTEPQSDSEFDPQPEIPRSFTQRWLSRLAFSFVIIAVYLIWTAAHLQNQSTRQAIYLVGAAASGSLAFAGMRERHRRG